MSESCKSCRFFQKLPSVEAGHCRRNPPVVVGTSNGLSFEQPAVCETDWCGEYQEKPEKSGG